MCTKHRRFKDLVVAVNFSAFNPTRRTLLSYPMQYKLGHLFTTMKHVYLFIFGLVL